MTIRIVTDPEKHPTRTSFTAWAAPAAKSPATATLEQLGGDMLRVVARDLDVEPTRIFLGIGTAPDPAEQDIPGAALHFRVELSVDGVKLTADQANIVEARLRRSMPALRRVAESS